MSSGSCRRFAESDNSDTESESETSTDDLTARESFESKIRFDITMRCLSALVTEPQCYHCDANSRLEKMHSTCVSNQMRSDMFVSKTWASFHTSLNSMLKNVVNAVSAQGHAASIGEGCRYVISWVGIQFLKPCSQSAACRGPQRNRSLLSSLALE